MLFNEFANVLFKHYSGSFNRAEFLLDLFDNIIRDPSTPEEQILYDNGNLNPFDKLKVDTLERYVSGSLSISKRNANKVISLIDSDKFASYINQLNWNNQTKINEDFSDMIPNFNTDDNLGYACADLFIQILNDISDGNEHSSQQHESNTSKASDSKLTSYPAASIRYSPDSGKLHIDEIEINIPKEIEPPENIASQETTYINELLCAYSDAMNVEIINISDIDSLPLRYKRNFSEQRINYFSAKRIEKFVNEAFVEGDKQVALWKDDTMSYISDTLWDDYENGYKRLSSVMQKVVDCSTTSIVETLHNLLGPKEKKGVCHLLVIDKQIRWVDEND